MGKVIYSSSQIDDFGRRVLRLLEDQCAKLNTSGLMITLVQSGENPHPVVTIIREKTTRSFQIDYEELALATTDAALSEKIRRNLARAIEEISAQ